MKKKPHAGYKFIKAPNGSRIEVMKAATARRYGLKV